MYRQELPVLDWRERESIAVSCRLGFVVTAFMRFDCPPVCNSRQFGSTETAVNRNRATSIPDERSTRWLSRHHLRANCGSIGDNVVST